MAWTLVGNIKGTPGANGAQGPQGIQGNPGSPGATGPGVAAGGATGSILTKASATDYATQWTAQLATGQIADRAITNVKLGTDTARLNLLVNGGFDIKQRSAASVTANDGYLLDGWRTQFISGSSATITQITSTIGSKGLSGQVAYTHAAGGSVRQTNQSLIEQLGQLRGRTLTLAVSVKSTVAGTVRVVIYDSVSGAVNSAFNVGTTEERLTVTATVAAAAAALYAWVEVTTASCTVEVNDAMLVVGSVPADYAPLHPVDELARCLRYYEISPGGSGSVGIMMGQAISTTQAEGPYIYRVEKAVAPSVTFTGAGNYYACAGNMAQIAGTAIALDGAATTRSAMVRVTVASGLTTGQGSVIQAVNSGGVFVVEANP